MSALNIVHISPSPLVGAPGKIAWMQKEMGHHAVAVAISDYPNNGPLAKKFLDRTIVLEDFTRRHIETCIRGADILHIHNFLMSEQTEWIRKVGTDALMVYHQHSPFREGPLYYDRSDSSFSFDYQLKLVVGQNHGRFLPTAIPVPNLILSTPSFRPRQRDECLRVMFSPTHAHPGRWSNKHSEVLRESLNALSKIGKIEVVSPDKPVTPETLMEIRRRCHISIDEITSGGFHQVSLEGMCAGNIVVNRADFFAKSTFAGFCENNMPPFHYADDSSITQLLLYFADRPEETARCQEESFDYFTKYCNPLRLIEIYDAAYQTIL